MAVLLTVQYHWALTKTYCILYYQILVRWQPCLLAKCLITTSEVLKRPLHDSFCLLHLLHAGILPSWHVELNSIQRRLSVCDVAGGFLKAPNVLFFFPRQQQRKPKRIMYTLCLQVSREHWDRLTVAQLKDAACEHSVDISELGSRPVKSLLIREIRDSGVTYQQLTIKELELMLAKVHLTITGSKADLINRLLGDRPPADAAARADEVAAEAVVDELAGQLGRVQIKVNADGEVKVDIQ